MKSYRINEIFYSLQGEGLRAGCPSLFLRFSRCNLSCAVETHGFDCDTDFEAGIDLTAQQIVQKLDSLSSSCRWVVLTGGEPALQLDDSLIDALHANRFHLAIETNGMIELPLGLDWITVSPKTADETIRQRRADEVKFVRSWGESLPNTGIEADHYLISPAFDGDHLERKNLEWCIELVRSNPPWRLSLQQHKAWGLR